MQTLTIFRTSFRALSIDVRIYKKRRCVPMSKIYETEEILKENE